MARISVSELLEIKDSNLSNSVLSTYIDTANAIINNNIDCFVGLDEATLKKIELFLSAHLVELVDPSSATRVVKEKSEQLETQYATATITDTLMQTTYGYTANMLSNGCLSRLDNTALIIQAVGHDYAE